MGNWAYPRFCVLPLSGGVFQVRDGYESNTASSGWIARPERIRLPLSYEGRTSVKE